MIFGCIDTDYFDEYMQVTKHELFHDGGTCRIETSPLIYSAN